MNEVAVVRSSQGMGDWPLFRSKSLGHCLRAARIALCAVLMPLATSASGQRLLVVHEGKAVEALAVRGDAVWFAVQPPPAWQPNPEVPPVFPPVTAEGHQAAGSVAAGLWTSDGLKWLATLPGEIAKGGPDAYAILDIQPDASGAWVTGPVNFPEKPIGRFYLARLDRDGRAGIETADDGPAAVALAPASPRPCVARNPEPGSPGPVARIVCPGWSKAFRVTGPGAFLSWIPGYGLAVARDGIWAIATFMGTVQVDDRKIRSPSMSDLPFLGDEDGGLPPAVMESLRQMLQSQSLPPLGTVMVIRIDGKGRVMSLTRLAPDAIRIGVATGESGMDPAIMDTRPLLVSDSTGRAFVFGRFEHAIRAGDLQITTPSGSDYGRHCFIASWQASGALRWLRDIADCTGQPIGLVADDGQLVAITSHKAIRLDPETGAVQAAMAIPRALRTKSAPKFHWSAADIAGNDLVLGGTFRGTAEILGQHLNEKNTSVVIARVPLNRESDPEISPAKR